MKIGNSSDNPAAGLIKTTPGAAATTNGATQAAGAAAASTAIPAQADASAKIQLSSTASTLLTGSSTPEFDAEKVARISKAIDDGSFKINPEAIADKLISNANELLGKIQP